MPTIQKMRSFGVKSILDYSAEEDISAEEATEKEMAYVISISNSLISSVFAFAFSCGYSEQSAVLS